jgi:hypothetical protein
MRIGATLPLVVAALAASGCNKLSEPLPPTTFTLGVHVESDPGVPVTGASVVRGAKQVAATGPDGRARFDVLGADGDVVEAQIACPEGFSSPSKALSFRLARLAEPKRVVEIDVRCPPTERRVVVAVKAENGAYLPVKYLDKVVARTDASGAAHFALVAPPGAQFQVVLDTSERKDLKPETPSRPFTVGRHDEIFLFDQRFEVEKKRPPPIKRPEVAKCLTCGKDA